MTHIVYVTCTGTEPAVAEPANGLDGRASALDLEAEASVLAVLSAAPYAFDERARGLRMLLSSGPRALEALPLLLQPPSATATWDDLTLGSCAEILEPALRDALGAEAVHATAAAAASQPPLQAVLALRTGDAEQLRDAIGRCSASERAQILRVALGHAGSFSLTSRLAALAEVLRCSGREWRAGSGI